MAESVGEIRTPRPQPGRNQSRDYSMTDVELCVDNPAAVAVSSQLGADRVELCSALAVGGVTPSHALVQAALEAAAGMPVHVLIRSRPGNFVYTKDELGVMASDIRYCVSAGASGVVVGALEVDGTLAESAIARLKDAADTVNVTLHRAFDQTPSGETALELAIAMQLDRILTSGHAESAIAGRDELQSLAARAEGRICIMAAGGVRSHNVRQLVLDTQVSAVHSSAQIRRTRRTPDPFGFGETAALDTQEAVALIRIARGLGPPY